ncbi:beta-ketoacyl synthase N-terminal-like domain-containing protein, partial [Corynebacterium nasicanis]
MSESQASATMSVEQLRGWLRDWVVGVTGLAPEEITDTKPMENFGLSSRDAVVLSGELENLLGVQLDATIAYEYPTIQALAQRLADGEPAARTRPRVRYTGGTEQTPGTHDIAIIGMAGRFPGAENLAEYWAMLVEGRDGTGELPIGRWSEYASEEVMAAKMAEQTLTGGYLTDLSTFDAEFFGLSPLEAANMDPQQRIMLEVAWEALENAHLAPNSLRGESVGVFLGSSNNDYGMLITADPAEAHPYALTGTASSIIPNRISYAFDFRGPSVNIDTACSSSLVAVHQAVRALRDGDADVALAGGVNILASPFVTTAFGELGVLSPTGHIHAFSDDADGFIRSDGAGIVVLKRVADALADGDEIRAVIKGSAVNSDGHSNGLTAPNPDAQIDVLARAYADAGVDPRDVDYIEAHGTGTILGDPIEATALGAVLGEDREMSRPTLLGSVKSNIGHSESAAGAAGLIKVVQAIGEGVIPPSLHFDAPNRYIDFDAERLEVVEDPREWPEYSGRRIAGVSGFGFGGTNAHVVVASFDPADYEDAPAREAQLPGDSVLLPVSGLLPSRRRQAAADLAE